MQFRSTNNRKLISVRTAKAQTIFQFNDDLFLQPQIKPITNKKLFSDLLFQKRFIMEQIITKQTPECF